MKRKLGVRAKALMARRARVRRKISGSADRPRVSVRFTNKNIIVQLVNDDKGSTLAYVATGVKSSKLTGNNLESAKQVGSTVGEEALKLGLKELVFDRGSRRYHGKVKEVATAIREKGLLL
ncbi:MAG: 50S ribosomal protein L18 [Nitrospinota bacterium]